ncbi:hypothetical protein BELL_0683g00010 [Botrytis elliptica]|uniref:Cupin type-2 domain-containing protein n=1 Tax=Botrytis elliptica TaxID=278938 RepID=A0A4Z1JAJ6_9HELO|nr:hypothetical protein BELL_0683g00010 [Botrytis elliptica]
MSPPASIAPQPNVPVHCVKAETGEVITLGNVKLRVLEDGSRTDNRISTVEGTLPAGLKGPPAHWHEMHDECFLVTKGVPANPSTGESEKRIDAGVGDYVVVPPRAPHTFSNETDEEAKFVNTFTPFLPGLCFIATCGSCFGEGLYWERMMEDDWKLKRGEKEEEGKNGNYLARKSG